MKQLYLLRHGDANHGGPPKWKTDADRPLTEDGYQAMVAAARGMRTLGITFDHVVTSPFRRARQTADAVASVLHLGDRMVESELVLPGASLKDLERSLRGLDGDSILVVGHAPDLGLWAGSAIGADEIPMASGTLVGIELTEPGALNGKGRLSLYMPVDRLVAAGGSSPRPATDRPRPPG